MFSFGGSFLTTEGLISSLATPMETAMFAAPLIIDVKFVCSFCEKSYEVTSDTPRERKQLEDIALEHFKRRILRTAEESLGDASAIFPGDHDGTRYRKLLGSLTLCRECTFHFAKTEQIILQDQLKYLGKMKDPKSLEEVFNDPWLDLKRSAFHTMRCQEPTIKEKLELIENMFSNENLWMANDETAASTSTSTSTASTSISGSVSTTTASTQPVLVTTLVNLPFQLVDPDSNHCRQTTPSDQASNATSIMGSPQPVIENDSSNDSINSKNKDDDTNQTCQSQGDVSNALMENRQEDLQQIQGQEDATGTGHDVNKEKSENIQINESDQNKNGEGGDDKGDKSETMSDTISHSGKQTDAIPAMHMSPVVRLDPLSGSKTPKPSTPRTGSVSKEPTSAKKPPPARKLNMDEEGLVKAVKTTSTAVANVDAVDNNMTEKNIHNVGNSTNRCQSPELFDDDVSQRDQTEKNQTNQDKIGEIEMSREDQENVAIVAGTIIEENENKNVPSVNSTTKAKKLASTYFEDKDSDSSEYDILESDSVSDSAEDSDDSYVEPPSKAGKRKRNSTGGGTTKRKKLPRKYGAKIKIPRPNRTPEKESSSSSPIKSATSSQQKKPTSRQNTQVATSVTSTTPTQDKSMSSDSDTQTPQSVSTNTSKSANTKNTNSSPSVPSTSSADQVLTQGNSKKNSTHVFATPTIPKKFKNNGLKAKDKNRKKSASESDTGSIDNARRKKTLSVVDCIKETFGSRVGSQAYRSANAKTTPIKASPKSKGKKVFKIGNRYLTEDSSSDDSDDDADYIPASSQE